MKQIFKFDDSVKDVILFLLQFFKRLPNPIIKLKVFYVTHENERKCCFLFNCFLFRFEMKK